MGHAIIDTSLAIDSYSGFDFDFALGWAVTRWLELNVKGRYMGDEIDCDDQPKKGPPRSDLPHDWYYNGWENRVSIDRADTDIGAKLVLGKLFGSNLRFALYPWVSIATGQERDTTLHNMYYASYYGRRSYSNSGGVFRYFTNGTVAPGGAIFLSRTSQTHAPISLNLNLGYQMKGAASELQYGLGGDILFFDYFDPFIEFWGKRRMGGVDFGDDLPSYLSLGMKFLGQGMSADICVDLLVIGKREYDFEDFLPSNLEEAADNHVATGWGMRPTWAINFGFGYSYDFYKMRPVTNHGMVIGRIIDAVTKDPVDAIIAVTGTPRLISDPLTGSYEGETDHGQVRVVVAKKGYVSQTKLAMVSRGEKAIVDFELEPQVTHGVITGKTIDKWTTKPIENAKTVLTRRKDKLPDGKEIKPGTLSKTIDGRTYELNPQTRTWELTSESLDETDITTIIEGELFRLNVMNGEWEKVKGAPPVTEEEEITNIIDGELHRLNLVTGQWEIVKNKTKLEDVVKEDDLTESFDGELYKLNLLTGVWEKVKAPTTEFAELVDTVVHTNEGGFYKLDLVPPGTQLVSVEKDGFIPQTSPVVVKGMETSILNFELIAKKIILRGVHFQFDKADLLVDAYPMLEKLYQFLKEEGDIRVEIGGHTDWIASDAYNLELSDSRANTVRNYLIKHGVAPDRLTAVGYGESQPVTNNDTDEGRALNRRIELKILTD
jgi:outer membrane protein OmpA-like peptidoglycan-associated protein